MAIDPAVVSGAKQIIQCYLGQARGQNLLIFTDKTTGDELAVQRRIILPPLSLQSRIPSKINLSLLRKEPPERLEQF